jgi:hypothetical protein
MVLSAFERTARKPTNVTTPKYLANPTRAPAGGLSAGNSATNVAVILAAPTGSLSSNGRAEYSLTEAIDSTVLVSSSYSLLADACRALRNRGEPKSLTVQVNIKRNDGVFVPYHSGDISYGLSMVGPNAAQ